MTLPEIAYYLWEHSKRTYGELDADAAWFLALDIMRGERPSWLFDRDDFFLFGTGTAYNGRHYFDEHPRV